MIYTFGYYALWSKVFFAYLPDEYAPNNFTKIITLMGFPFLGIGLLMLLFWVKNLVTKQIHSLIIVGVFLFLFGTTVVYGLFSGLEIFSTVSDMYNAFAVGILIFALFVLIYFKSTILNTQPKILISLLMTCAAILHMSFLLNFGIHELVLPTYNFLFFLIYTALVVVFIYNAKVELSQEDKMLGVSIENFVERHRVTNREREIIEELLRGKTNQEIADSLFISLQTVKDHISRIYLKTHLKNRTQLISHLRSNK